MEGIVQNGTEVLVFKYVSEWGPNQDQEHFIKGVVQSSKLSDDLAYHGSPWNVQIYTVLGEDGKQYYGTYGSPVIGNSFFRTVDDHVAYLNRKIIDNNQKIEKLNKMNDEYSETIIELEKSKQKVIVKSKTI